MELFRERVMALGSVSGKDAVPGIYSVIIFRVV